MADVSIAPKPVSRQTSFKPELGVRRFGRHEFERFNQEAARGSHLCVGSGAIGKVQIECKYHWKTAQWGVIGTNENPAGIVYIDIAFKQPPEHSLSSANILITLSEESDESPSNKRNISRRPIRTSLDAEHAVQVTEFFGPHYLTGQKTVSSEVNEKSFQPTLGAGGLFEIGGVGARKSVSREQVDSWTFKGTVKRAKGGQGFRCLEWELKEDEAQSQPHHNHVFHTAFAFEHSEKPVIMRVEVEGRLKSRMRQNKHKLLKFCSKSADRDNSMLTRIGLSSSSTGFQKRLDGIAEGLNWAMQKENIEAVPVEIPGPTQATFEQLSPQATSDHHTTQAMPSAKVEEIQGVDSSLEELKAFLQQSVSGDDAQVQSEDDDGSDSRSSEDTLLNDNSDQASSTGSLGPAQFAWRVREVVALAIIRWLVMMLKVMGTDQHAELLGVPIAVGQHERTNFKESPSKGIERLKQELANDSLLESMPQRKLLDSSSPNVLKSFPASSRRVARGEDKNGRKVMEVAGRYGS